MGQGEFKMIGWRKEQAKFEKDDVEEEVMEEGGQVKGFVVVIEK